MKFLLLPAVLLYTAFSLIGAELKVAILSDIHVSPGNPNEQRLQQAIAEINESDGPSRATMKPTGPTAARSLSPNYSDPNGSLSSGTECC